MTPEPFLARLIALGDIDPQEQGAIAAACGPSITLEANQTIVEAGEEPDFSVALLRGIACRVNDLDDGRRQILAFQVPGDGVDLYGYALKKLDHSVVTLTQCEISRIPHAMLDDLVVRYPQLALTLWRETILDTSLMREQLVRIGQRPAMERTANLFCELIHRFESAGFQGGEKYAFPITQGTLASALGISTIHVNRILKQLRDDGVMMLSRSSLIIKDRRKLELLGNFNPAYLETVKLHRTLR